MEKNHHLEVNIIGMDCAECVVHVQKALTDLPEVESAQVYLGAEKAIINYSENRPTDKTIFQAVKDAGYQATLQTSETLDDADSGSLHTFGKTSIASFILIVFFVLGITIIGEQFGILSRLQESIPWYIWATLVTVGGWRVFVNVGKALRKKRIISHTLMTASVITAAAIGEWATALLIVFFMRFGDFIERQTTEKARQAVHKLNKIAPKTAHIVTENTEKDIEISKLRVGDLVVVKPGESIPVDGLVVEGTASVNQSAISGESMPVEMTKGQHVFAASILQTGMLKIKATGVGKESLFGKIIQMVEQAEANRGEFQQLADKFSSYYLPIVGLIALVTYLISRNPFSAAAVMAVACSCSFSLATPVAMLASIGTAAQQGLLFKGGKYIESLEKVNAIFIDKTGTLTLGEPFITEIFIHDNFSERKILQLAASAEKYSEHPLAKAILRAAENQNIRLVDAIDFTSTPGKGITATVSDLLLEINNKPNQTNEEIRKATDRMRADGKTLVFVHINGKLAAIMGAEDILRNDAKQAIDFLKKQGLHDISLISGDNRVAVQKVADQLGIDFHAEMRPDEKIKIIEKAQLAGKHVLMVGDGVNDAPALARADIGIAMGTTGTEISIETSHIVLLREDWSLIPEAFNIAKQTMRIVRLNILFTAFYNLIGLSLAAIGLLPPAISAAMQSIPDIGIMANSARLLKIKPANQN